MSTPITFHPDPDALTSTPTQQTAAALLESVERRVAEAERRLGLLPVLRADIERRHAEEVAALDQAEESARAKRDAWAAKLPDAEAAAAEEARRAELALAEARLAELQAVDKAERARKAEIKALTSRVTALSEGTS